MRKGDRRISHSQTQHCFQQQRFYKSSASRGAETHHGKCTGLYTPVPVWWCPAGWQEQALSRLFSASCCQKVLSVSVSHPRKMCMTQGRKCFRGERKKTTLQTGKETWEQASWAKSLNLLFQLNAFPVSDLLLFYYHKRNLNKRWPVTTAGLAYFTFLLMHMGPEHSCYHVLRQL